MINLPTTGNAGRELWELRRAHLGGLPMPVVAMASVTTPCDREHVDSTHTMLDPPVLVAILEAILSEHSRREQI